MNKMDQEDNEDLNDDMSGGGDSSDNGDLDLDINGDSNKYSSKDKKKKAKNPLKNSTGTNKQQQTLLKQGTQNNLN